MREIEYRQRASLDLDSILVYLMVVRSPQAVRKVADALLESIERVAEVPSVGHAFDDDDLHDTYRRILSGSYWIYYTFDENTLTVWRIFHTSQDTDEYGFELFE